LQVVWANIEGLLACIGFARRGTAELTTRGAKLKADACRHLARTKKGDSRLKKNQQLQVAIHIFYRFLAAANGDPVIGLRLMSMDYNGRKHVARVLAAYGGPTAIEKYRENTISDLQKWLIDSQTRIHALKRLLRTPLGGSLRKRELTNRLAAEIKQKTLYAAKLEGYELLGATNTINWVTSAI
jgi:hypothetical protein